LHARYCKSLPQSHDQGQQESGSKGKVARYAANNLSLAFRGMKEFEPVLKPLPVSQLRCEDQVLIQVGKSQLKLNNLSQDQVARDGSAHASLRNIFGTAM